MAFKKVQLDKRCWNVEIPDSMKSKGIKDLDTWYGLEVINYSNDTIAIVRRALKARASDAKFNEIVEHNRKLNYRHRGDRINPKNILLSSSLSCSSYPSYKYRECDSDTHSPMTESYLRELGVNYVTLEYKKYIFKSGNSLYKKTFGKLKKMEIDEALHVLERAIRDSNKAINSSEVPNEKKSSTMQEVSDMLVKAYQNIFKNSNTQYMIDELIKNNLDNRERFLVRSTDAVLDDCPPPVILDKLANWAVRFKDLMNMNIPKYIIKMRDSFFKYNPQVWLERVQKTQKLMGDISKVTPIVAQAMIGGGIIDKLTFDLPSYINFAMNFNSIKSLEQLYLEQLKKIYKNTNVNPETVFMDRLITYNNTFYSSPHRVLDRLAKLSSRKYKNCNGLTDKQLKDLYLKPLQDIDELTEHLVRDLDVRRQALKFQEIQTKFSNLETTIDGVEFHIAKSSEELIRLGKYMNNCVASYAEKIARGESIILYATKNSNMKDIISDTEHTTVPMHRDVNDYSSLCISISPTRLEILEMYAPSNNYYSTSSIISDGVLYKWTEINNIRNYKYADSDKVNDPIEIFEDVEPLEAF